jgi:hypothetical protein
MVAMAHPSAPQDSQQAWKDASLPAAGARLYRALDDLLPHESEVEAHLGRRSGELFDISNDVLLDDVTRGFPLGLSPPDAFMLVNAVGDVRVNQACRSPIDVSVRVEIRKLDAGLTTT